MVRKLRIATRNSPLALWQAHDVADRLRGHGVETELVPMTSAGDQNLQPISGMRQVGVFTKRIQQALLDDEADIAVHSMKDLPTEVDAALAIAAIPPRQDVRDALIRDDGRSLSELPAGTVIGTGSLRRQAQILNRFPHLKVKPIRGNVQSRLSKYHAGEVDALMLANIGLTRLEMSDVKRTVLEIDEMIPAVGQGALAVEVRHEDSEAWTAVHQIDDAASRLAVVAERAFLRTLEGGCLAPIAAHAHWKDARLTMTAVALSPGGERRKDGGATIDLKAPDPHPKLEGKLPDGTASDALREAESKALEFATQLAQEFLADGVTAWFR